MGCRGMVDTPRKTPSYLPATERKLSRLGNERNRTTGKEMALTAICPFSRPRVHIRKLLPLALSPDHCWTVQHQRENPAKWGLYGDQIGILLLWDISIAMQPLVLFGGDGGIRTRDPRLKRPLLYRLSYIPKGKPWRRQPSGLRIIGCRRGRVKAQSLQRRHYHPKNGGHWIFPSA